MTKNKFNIVDSIKEELGERAHIEYQINVLEHSILIKLEREKEANMDMIGEVHDRLGGVILHIYLLYVLLGISLLVIIFN